MKPEEVQSHVQRSGEDGSQTHEPERLPDTHSSYEESAAEASASPAFNRILSLIISVLVPRGNFRESTLNKQPSSSSIFSTSLLCFSNSRLSQSNWPWISFKYLIVARIGFSAPLAPNFTLDLNENYGGNFYRVYLDIFDP